MQTYNSRLRTELEKAITARIETLRDSLETPNPTFPPDYFRGQIYALRQMEGIIDEAAAAADQNNR